MSLLLRRLLAVLAALVLLAGCSSKGEQDATELPDGLQRVTAEQAGISFGAPEDWEVAGAEFLDNEGSQAELKALAERSGISLEQLQQQVSQADVIVISPEDNENINVLPLEGVSALPSQEDLERDLGTVGASVEGVEDTETEFGEARVATYAIPTTTGEQFGSSLFVVVDDQVVNLTSTAGSVDRATELTMQAVDTLTAAE